MKDLLKKDELPYAQITNDILNSKEISLKAKGLYAYMYSKPNQWNFTIKSMASQLKDGSDSIKSALQELKSFGWISYSKHQNGTGTYHIHIEPKVENPNEENPYKGKSTPISNKDIPIKKDNYKVDAETVYSHYIKLLKASSSKQRSINNIAKWLKEYNTDDLIKSIHNYNNVANRKFLKDCANFFGVSKESNGFFKDYLNIETNESAYGGWN